MTKKKVYIVKDLVIDDQYGIIDSKATIREAAKKMKEIGVPDLVVMENGKKVLGVIGDFDIVHKVAEGTDCNKVSVIDAMYVIEPVHVNTTVQEAFNRMQRLQVNVVPVVENGELKGVCTIQDCWSYIPDETFDDIGLIPVENTKFVEFWFASICSIIALIFGVIFPLIGIYGYFYADETNVLGALGIIDIRIGTTAVGFSAIEFFLFEARGPELLIPYSSIVSTSGVIWIFVDLFSIVLVILGILSLFTIIYASYSDTRRLLAGRRIRVLIPGLFIVFMILEWIIFGIALSLSLPSIPISIDVLGLLFSIISIVFVIFAVFRDYFFRGKESSVNKIEGAD